MKFYRCKKCGQIIAIVKETKVPVMCCGEKMEEIIPGTTDAAVEKHVPVYEVKDGIVTVTVGSVEHPMAPEHYIEWIAIKTTGGNQRKELKPGDAPKPTQSQQNPFCIEPGFPVNVLCQTLFSPHFLVE